MLVQRVFFTHVDISILLLMVFINGLCRHGYLLIRVAKRRIDLIYSHIVQMLTEETEHDQFELVKAADGLLTGQILTAVACRVTHLLIFGRAVVA